MIDYLISQHIITTPPVHLPRDYSLCRGYVHPGVMHTRSGPPPGSVTLYQATMAGSLNQPGGITITHRAAAPDITPSSYVDLAHRRLTSEWAVRFAAAHGFTVKTAA